MKNIFERASKQKLRFNISRGLISTEGLWDLSLTSLDTLAKSTNKALKESDEESFIKAKTTASTELNLKMEIIKHVIDYKLDLKEAAVNRAAKAEKLAKLKEIYASKADAELEGLSKADLEKQIAALEG